MEELIMVASLREQIATLKAKLKAVEDAVEWVSQNAIRIIKTKDKQEYTVWMTRDGLSMAKGTDGITTAIDAILAAYRAHKAKGGGSDELARD